MNGIRFFVSSVFGIMLMIFMLSLRSYELMFTSYSNSSLAIISFMATLVIYFIGEIDDIREFIAGQNQLTIQNGILLRAIYNKLPKKRKKKK